MSYPVDKTPSLALRVTQIICSIIWCLLAAGPVFGFAALKPILIKEGVYSDKCDIHAESSNGTCSEQDLSLNLLFTVACMVTNICALPVGSILDSYGPKITGIIGSFIILIGSIFLQNAKAITNHLHWFDGYLAGYTFLALGGPFVFISCFQLANSFPKNSGLILALLTGSFDSSSALFLIYRVIYTNYFELNLHQFFTAYMVVPIFIFLCQLFIMPTDSYKTVGTLAKIAETAIDETGKPINRKLLLPSDRHDSFSSNVSSSNIDSLSNVSDFQQFQQPSMTETTSLLMKHASNSRRNSVILRASYTSRTSIKSIYEQDAEDKLIQSSGGVFGIMHGYTIIEQLKSPWFYLMTFFTTIQMLRINYFVATVRSQELYLYNGDELLATKINQFFDLALPLGGLISIPFIGLLLDNLTTLSILIILSIVSIFIGIMGLLSWIPGTYAGIICLVVYRPFYYTAVSDFCAKVFGFDTFGTVYGTIIAFSGVCNILQQFMDKLTHEYFNMNPIPINGILTLLTIVFALGLIGFVRSQELEMRRKNLELEAQEASTRGIPN